MKQFLLKMREVLQRLFRISATLAVRTLAALRSVNIDQPRGAILCVTLQLVIALSIIIAFNRSGELVQPLKGQSPPQASEPEIDGASNRGIDEVRGSA